MKDAFHRAVAGDGMEKIFMNKEKLWEVMSADNDNVYAYKGELATCPQGHPVFEFPETVYIGQKQTVRKLIWHQPMPEPGSDISFCKCARCGTQWAKKIGVYFIDGEWRTRYS